LIINIAEADIVCVPFSDLIQTILPFNSGNQNFNPSQWHHCTDINMIYSPPEYSWSVFPAIVGIDMDGNKYALTSYFCGVILITKSTKIVRSRTLMNTHYLYPLGNLKTFLKIWRRTIKKTQRKLILSKCQFTRFNLPLIIWHKIYEKYKI
jgi:hypothetical protein